MKSEESMHVARDFVKDQFPTPGGGPGLWFHAGEYLAWKDRWVVRGEEELRGALWLWLENAHFATPDGTRRFMPTGRSVSDVMDAMRAVTACRWATLPMWTKQPGDSVPLPSPATCIAFRDVVVSVGGGVIRTFPRDERWLDVSMVDQDWEPGAECPRWGRALEEWGEGDARWGELLRRMMGYCLMGKREYAKWFLLQGKSRGGKGVICRTLRKLVGDQAWFSSSISALAGRFGLDGVQHARVMSVPEVSLDDFSSRQRVAQIMKEIVGGDEMSIDVKFQRQKRNVRVKAVPVLSGNMIPQLSNEAQSLSGKMVVLPFTRTFLGTEQFDLEEELDRELAGIAAWAVEGARRLEAEGGRGWEEPAAAETVRLRFRIENNPFDAFLEARCVKEPEGFVPTAMLWREFQDWQDRNGVKMVVPRNYFAAKLESGCTWDIHRSKRRVGDRGVGHVIIGLRLRREVDDEI